MRYPEFHYRWEWQLESSPEALWPYVSDTNRFNRATGVPPVRSTDGKEIQLVNGRRHLRLTRLGVPIEWEEEPFEWVRPRRFGVNRRYVSGPVAEMRVLGDLSPRPGGGTRLVYQVWARPRSLFGLIAIPGQIGILSARNFSAAFRKDDRLAAKAAQLHRPGLELGSRQQLEPGGQARLGEIRARLVTQGVVAEWMQQLIELIERGDDLTLTHIRPYFLADVWGAPRRDVLELCLHATRAGLLDMQWDLLCPLCRGTKMTARSLNEIETQVHCEVCHIDFSVNFDRAVELTFRPNPAIRVIDVSSYCVGGPQVTPHIVMQQLLPPHTRRSIELMLEAGRYRARALELRGAQFLMAESGTADADHLTIRAGDDGWPTEESRVTLQPTLELINDTEREQLMLLERMAWSDQAVTAAEVTTMQTFRDLFSSEALRPGEQITVGSLTVVFTDLRGSTQMYQQIGDAPAFGRVMDHFAVLRHAIDAEGGAIVKTIGDAVMAVFRRPISALRAMVAAQDELASSATLLVLKVGMHFGPCIAVTLNDRLDYFGTTVNIAARIQNLSEGGDILISDEVMQDSEVSAWLASRQGQLTYETFDANLKGIHGVVRLWRLMHACEPVADTSEPYSRR
jgi:class 3 adenylate cyclase